MSDEYDKPILIQIQTWFILVELNGIWTYFPLGMSKNEQTNKNNQGCENSIMILS